MMNEDISLNAFKRLLVYRARNNNKSVIQNELENFKASLCSATALGVRNMFESDGSCIDRETSWEEEMLFTTGPNGGGIQIFDGSEKYLLRARKNQLYNCSSEKLFPNSSHSIADFFRFLGLLRNRFNENMNDSLQASIIGKLNTYIMLIT